MPRLRQLGIGLVVFSVLATARVTAQQVDTTAHTGLGFGVKAGVGFNPDQFVIGAQYSLGRTLKVLRIVPNINLGLGDFTTWDFNVDFLLRLILKDSRVGIYGGAAPTLITGEGDTEFGGTLIAGVLLPLLRNHSTSIEARFGLGDVPDFRLLGVLVF
jgi:hypothetical protein